MSKLTECLTGYNTIAVTGMCKNAGKTTVINHIIDEYHTTFSLGLTSIGYDGEENDEVTLLKKPKIMVYPGMFVGTCENCLDSSEAENSIIYRTGVSTVLGEVVIVEIISVGFMEISGPSVVSQLEALCETLRIYGCNKILVDGSAGRLSFASHMDCSILACGAALSQDMSKVVKLAEHQIALLQTPIAPEFSPSDDVAFIHYKGAVVDSDVAEFIRTARRIPKHAVVKDAAALFISPHMFRKFLHKGGSFFVKRKPNLVAITINPMSPYGKWFDKDRFLKKMQEIISLPVINVMDRNNAYEQ